MKVLLDTNIIVYREVHGILNSNVHELYFWLDKVKYDKYISPITIKEIEKNKDKKTVKIFKAKLSSYNILPEVSKPDDKYNNLLNSKFPVQEENDVIDNQLLYEVYSNRVDLLITEDRKILKKAILLSCKDRVVNIEDFLYQVKKNNPRLKDYQNLAIKKLPFRNVNLDDNFFDNFKKDYKGFEKWFDKKKDEEAYVCYQDDKVLGFLYLKQENSNEDYSSITPLFKAKKRLKIGTFKVNSSGFRLGERFLKIIFDNALLFNVDEIYVTLFESRDELKRLSELLKKWGFEDWGIKTTESGIEKVLIKRLNTYDNSKSVVYNFPNLKDTTNKYILPIKPEFHTELLPDAKMKREVLDLSNFAHRYALEKIYITRAFNLDIKEGDLILFYRMGPENTTKKYSSVITSLGIFSGIETGFNNEQEFLSACKNRTVFSKKQLANLWKAYRNNIKLIKFIYYKELNNKVDLKTLRDLQIIGQNDGPRPFTKISNEQFIKILQVSATKI